VRCYFEHPWGTHWEPEEHHGEPKGNPWVIHRNTWEHDENTKDFKSLSSPPPPPPRKKKKPPAGGARSLCGRPPYS